MFRSINLPDIPENEIEMNIESNKKIQDLPFLTELDNDIQSVTGTSCSYGDLSFENNMGCNIQASLGRSIDCLEKYSSSNADIGNISVQSSADVTFGNKTFFNAPVVIKHFVASDSENPDSSETKTGQHICKSFDCVRKRPVLLGSILTAFVVSVIVVIVAAYFLHFYENVAPSTNQTEEDYYELINRTQYLSQSTINLNELHFPVTIIVVSRTLTLNCTNYEECVARILNVHQFHINQNKWDDIGCNFLFGGDGRAYEGCGWYASSAIPNPERIIYVSFIGTFTDYEAPHKQLYAAQRFIEDGIRMNKIHQKYIFYAHQNIIDPRFSDNKLLNQVILWSWSNMSTVVHVNQYV